MHLINLAAITIVQEEPDENRFTRLPRMQMQMRPNLGKKAKKNINKTIKVINEMKQTEERYGTHQQYHFSKHKFH